MKKILLAILLCFSLTGCAASKRSLYQEAVSRIESQDYEEGYRILIGLEDYKDSHEIVVNSLNERIDKAMKEKDLESARNLLDELCDIGGTKENEDLLEKINIYYSLQDVEVGDTITIGSYLQESEEPEPIEWIVLAKQNNYLFVTTKKVIEVSPYHEEQRTVTWQGCALRKFLNETIYETAFSDAEKEFIYKSEIETNGSSPTEDYLFCLSVTEAQTYFTTNESRMAVATQYAKDKGVYVYDKTGGSYYWLRSMGDGIEKASYVFASGELTETSIGGLLVYTDNSDGGVRPAMWIDTNVFSLEE